MAWQHLWGCVKSEVLERTRSLKAKSRLPSGLRRNKSSASKASALGARTISHPRLMHVDSVHVNKQQQLCPPTPPASLRADLSYTTSTQELDASAAQLFDWSSSGLCDSDESSGSNDNTGHGRLHSKSAALATHATQMPQMPSPHEVDSCSLQLAHSLLLAAALTDGQTPTLHEPLRSHPVQPPLELFYPRLYHSIFLSDEPDQATSYRSAAYRPRDATLASCRTDDAPDDCEIYTCGSPFDRRPRFLLEHTICLYGPRHRRPAQMLVSQMDVTESVRTLATYLINQSRRQETRNIGPAPIQAPSKHPLPSLPTPSTKHASSRPVRQQRPPEQQRWRDSGCDMEPASSVDGSHVQSPSVDRTLEASPLLPADHSERLAHRHVLTSALHEFQELIADLRYLYRDVLILKPAPTMRYWQVSRTSANLQSACWPINYRIAQKGGDMHNDQTSSLSASLCHTSPDVLYQLGRAMALVKPVQAVVQWGVQAPGRAMRMYCVPLKADSDTFLDGSLPPQQAAISSLSWACWLTDVRVPDLWALRRGDGEMGDSLF